MYFTLLWYVSIFSDAAFRGQTIAGGFCGLNELGPPSLFIALKYICQKTYLAWHAGANTNGSVEVTFASLGFGGAIRNIRFTERVKVSDLSETYIRIS